MKKITFLAALFISIMFVACQNSNLEFDQVENLTDNEQIIPLRETFDFTYKGVAYSSTFYMENDTLMILEDKEVAAIYNKLQELPKLATYIAPNGDIEYYNTYEELEINKQSKELKNSRAYGTTYTIMIYEHADFNTQRQGIYRIINPPVEVPHVGNQYAMDDMISSFTAGFYNQESLDYTRGITFFRNPNYEAQSITFTYKEGTRDEMGYCFYCKVRNFRDYKVKKVLIGMIASHP